MPNVIFLCLGISLCLSVSASVSYILRLCKGYLPGTKGYVIYSSGTAPRATSIKLFLFRFSKAMQEKNSFQLLRPAFPSFFFSFSSFILFFSHKSRFFVSRCKGGMLRARPLLLHFRVPPPPPSLLPPTVGVIRGAYTGAVQAYLTFSICKLLTFSG